MPLNNLDKGTVTFKNREQLMRESLMMSDVEQNKLSARQPGGSEIRSMVFLAGGAVTVPVPEKSES